MSFWRGKSILVTGASGFIGSHIIKRLLTKDAEVIALSRSPRSDSIITSEKLYKSEHGSIENLSFLNSVIKRNKIDIIYHLAAQPLVEVGKKNPIKTFSVNIKGAWNILESARRADVQKVIVASTSHVYGDNPNLPYKEEYFPQPSRPYETSKACADLLAQSYADTYGLPVEIPRFTNIYGPGDFNFSRLIPKIIRSVLDNKNPEVWDIGTMRDFLYIDDAVDAYLKLAELHLPNTKRTRIINFGSGKPVKIISLAKRIVRLSGNKQLSVHVMPVPENRQQEIIAQYVHIGKAYEIINWKPKIGISEGLKKTLEWYADWNLYANR
jgi:CDP-glucose 4,6-dehydratase